MEAHGGGGVAVTLALVGLEQNAARAPAHRVDAPYQLLFQKFPVTMKTALAVALVFQQLIQPVNIVGNRQGIARLNHVPQQLMQINAFPGGMVQESGATGAQFTIEQIQTSALRRQEKSIVYALNLADRLLAKRLINQTGIFE